LELDEPGRRFHEQGKGFTMDLGLNGKLALVTGGSKGIGAGVARVLAEEGCTVHVAARSLDDLQATAGHLERI